MIGLINDMIDFAGHVRRAFGWVRRRLAPLEVRIEHYRTYKGHVEFAVRVDNLGNAPVVIEQVFLEDAGEAERKRSLLTESVGERVEPRASALVFTRIGTPEEVLAMGKEVRPGVVTVDGDDALGDPYDTAQVRAAVERGRRTLTLAEQMEAIAAAFSSE